MSKLIDIAGRKFGRWTVISLLRSQKQRNSMWLCRCACGTSAEVCSKDLRAGHSRSCGCLVIDMIRARSIKTDSGRSKLLRQYRASAKTRRLEFSLTPDEFSALTQGSCHYCGEPPSRTSVKHSPKGAYVYNGIDRKDNEQGYTSANSVSCCYVCNFFKRSMSRAAFLQRVKKIYEYTNLEGSE